MSLSRFSIPLSDLFIVISSLRFNSNRDIHPPGIFHSLDGSRQSTRSFPPPTLTALRHSPQLQRHPKSITASRVGNNLSSDETRGDDRTLVSEHSETSSTWGHLIAYGDVTGGWKLKDQPRNRNGIVGQYYSDDNVPELSLHPKIYNSNRARKMALWKSQNRN